MSLYGSAGGMYTFKQKEMSGLLPRGRRKKQ